MSKTYLCGWCEQEIRKNMHCGSIYGNPDCPWPARVKNGTVQQALREARQQVKRLLKEQHESLRLPT